MISDTALYLIIIFWTLIFWSIEYHVGRILEKL